jgi:aminoglycoside phosphotransferase (APT) family kinase protein
VPTPAAEVDVDAALVRALLHEQHPDLASLPVERVANGWDNAIFRIGDELGARLPRRALAVPLLLNERRWLPVVAAGLPLPIPVPTRAGEPGAGYPWPWAIGPWLPGAPAEMTPPADPDTAADALGRFVAALHRPAPADAPPNPFRGVPLAERAERMDEGLDRLGATIDRSRVEARWREALAVPPWPGPPLWLHGDLHPLNLLVAGGRLSGVIDFGDLTAGDPATDLAVAWMMFRGAARDRFRRASGADDDTWRRAHGWALTLGVAFAGGDGPVRAIGVRLLEAALAEEA